MYKQHPEWIKKAKIYKTSTIFKGSLRFMPFPAFVRKSEPAVKFGKNEMSHDFYKNIK
jgi:hypothetical protein